MQKELRKVAVATTGKILGHVGAASQPVPVRYHGYHLNNTDSASHTVKFYEPPAATTGNNQTTLPAVAGGTLIFTITVPANQSKEFVFDCGMEFKDGVFIIADNAALTGVIVWS